MLKIIKIIALLYLLFLIALYFWQRSFLYHPDRNLGKPSEYGVNYQDVQLATSDNVNIHAWHKAGTNGYHVVYFHGNADNLAFRAPKFKAITDAGFGITAVEYRGWGNSDDIQPTEQGLYKDAQAALDYAKAQLPNDKIILYGESLGTGIAVQTAVNNPHYGVFLEAPYSSVARRAQEIWWLTPAYYLVRDRFDSIAKIPALRTPLVILHGKNDLVIPYAHGQRLYKAAKMPKHFITAPTSGHSDHKHSDILRGLRWLVKTNNSSSSK